MVVVADDCDCLFSVQLVCIHDEGGKDFADEVQGDLSLTVAQEEQLEDVWQSQVFLLVLVFQMEALDLLFLATVPHRDALLSLIFIFLARPAKELDI